MILFNNIGVSTSSSFAFLLSVFELKEKQLLFRVLIATFHSLIL